MNSNSLDGDNALPFSSSKVLQIPLAKKDLEKEWDARTMGHAFGMPVTRRTGS